MSLFEQAGPLPSAGKEYMNYVRFVLEDCTVRTNWNSWYSQTCRLENNIKHTITTLKIGLDKQQQVARLLGFVFAIKRKGLNSLFEMPPLHFLSVRVGMFHTCSNLIQWDRASPCARISPTCASFICRRQMFGDASRGLQHMFCVWIPFMKFIFAFCTTKDVDLKRFVGFKGRFR
jgi:hypothetical protein